MTKAELKKMDKIRKEEEREERRRLK